MWCEHDERNDVGVLDVVRKTLNNCFVTTPTEKGQRSALHACDWRVVSGSGWSLYHSMRVSFASSASQWKTFTVAHNFFSASGVSMFGRNGCITERGAFRILHDSALRQKMEMEMDSHGGHKVTIWQTEWEKKNLPNNIVAQTSECS